MGEYAFTYLSKNQCLYSLPSLTPSRSRTSLSTCFALYIPFTHPFFSMYCPRIHTLIPSLPPFPSFPGILFIPHLYSSSLPPTSTHDDPRTSLSLQSHSAT